MNDSGYSDDFFKMLTHLKDEKDKEKKEILKQMREEKYNENNFSSYQSLLEEATRYNHDIVYDELVEYFDEYDLSVLSLYELIKLAIEKQNNDYLDIFIKTKKNTNEPMSGREDELFALAYENNNSYAVKKLFDHNLYEQAYFEKSKKPLSFIPVEKNYNEATQYAMKLYIEKTGKIHINNVFFYGHLENIQERLTKEIIFDFLNNPPFGRDSLGMTNILVANYYRYEESSEKKDLYEARIEGDKSTLNQSVIVFMNMIEYLFNQEETQKAAEMILKAELSSLDRNEEELGNVMLNSVLEVMPHRKEFILSNINHDIEWINHKIKRELKKDLDEKLKLQPEVIKPKI